MEHLIINHKVRNYEPKENNTYSHICFANDDIGTRTKRHYRQC